MKKVLISGFVGVVIGGVAAWFGRPQDVREVVVEKRVVEVRREVARNVVTKRTTETTPSGQTRVTEEIVDRSQEREASKDQIDKTKVITKKSLENRTEVLVGLGLNGRGQQTFLAGVTRQWLGPVTVGVFGTTTNDFGIRTSAIYGTIGIKF